MGIDYTATAMFGYRITRDEADAICERFGLDTSKTWDDSIETLTSSMPGFVYGMIGNAYTGDASAVIGPNVDLGDEPNPITPDHIKALAEFRARYEIEANPRWYVGAYVS